MGKKKSSGTKHKSEEDVYEDLQRLMQVWKKNGTQNLFSKRSYLSSVKMDFRSPRICQIVFSNPDIFNFEEEIKYIPMELMTEEFLIQMVYDKPKLLCSRDESGPRTISIPEEKQTLPVLVAFELGKRIYEKFSAMQWGYWGEKIPYTDKLLEFRKTITDIADKVEEKIGTNNLKHPQAFKETDERDAFINELVTLIQEESTSVALQPDEHYKPKYTHLDYNSDKKMLILVSGHADSGKTTFSRYLASTIDGAICFDSDQLLERGLLYSKLSQLVRPDDNVVIFSDPDAFDFFRPQEINDAMGNANILKVYIKPSSIKRMFHHSKYRRTDIDSYTTHYENFHKNHNLGMDVTVTNDYTRDSMLRGCDEVIDMINKLFGTQEVAKPSPRKSASDLLEELGDSRIEEGANRVENCELFKPQIIEDFEK